MSAHPSAVNRNRDLEITQMVVERNLDLEVVAKQIGVTSSRITQILSQTTRRAEVLAFLAANPEKKYTAREIAQTLHLDINKVAYVADSLRKKSQASIKKVGGDGTDSSHHTIIDIQITPIGVKAAQPLLSPKLRQDEPPKDKAVAAVAASYTNGKDSHGKPDETRRDMTDPRNHGSVAAGGPIERDKATMTDEEKRTFIADRIPDRPHVEAVGRPGSGDLEALRETVLAPPHTTGTPRPAPPAPTDLSLKQIPLQEEEHAPTEAAVPTMSEAEALLEIGDIPRYPLITKLTTRNEKLQAAAKLLESAGYDDIALTALAKLDDFTDLEREILGYVRAHSHPEEAQ